MPIILCCKFTKHTIYYELAELTICYKFAKQIICYEFQFVVANVSQSLGVSVKVRVKVRS